MGPILVPKWGPKSAPSHRSPKGFETQLKQNQTPKKAPNLDQKGHRHWTLTIDQKWISKLHKFSQKEMQNSYFLPISQTKLTHIHILHSAPLQVKPAFTSKFSMDSNGFCGSHRRLRENFLAKPLHHFRHHRPATPHFPSRPRADENKLSYPSSLGSSVSNLAAT